MNECYGNDNIFWYSMCCGVLEGGIHEVIGIQRILVSAIIKICNSKGLLVRRYCGTASIYKYEYGNQTEIVGCTFYMHVDKYTN